MKKTIKQVNTQTKYIYYKKYEKNQYFKIEFK